NLYLIDAIEQAKLTFSRLPNGEVKPRNLAALF
ncbi:MAG: hypothetical protein, partial [Olavius algarvensis Gamma 1 endosymbiont]